MNIPDLTISTTTAGLIELEQQNGLDEPDRIEVHPIHIRHIAETMGLVSTSDPQAARTIATLQRRLRVLLDRINHLDDWLHQHSDMEHADLSYEQTYSMATWELAREFCADLDEPGNATKRHETPAAETQTQPTDNPAETQRVPVGSVQLTLEA